MFGAYLAFRTRRVISKYNESSHIALCIYNVLVLSAIVLPVVSLPEVASPLAQFIILSIGILLLSSFTMYILIVTKILRIFGYVEDTEVSQIHEMKRASGSFEFQAKI